MYKLKLLFHNREKEDKNGNPIDDDAIINPSSCKDIPAGTIVEIYHPEDKQHVLLKVNPSSDFQQKDAISVDQTIGSTFRLRNYNPVFVNIVDKESVTLDLVEIHFKDQYFSRADFYRFSSMMRGTIVHVKQKLEYVKKLMRGNVGDMWCRGEKYSCGYVGPETKIVFRSSTSVVHIFIQMSQEMWDFDFFGDLYFEKTINFLAELFAKWNESGCSHDVTIVLFSRIFYDAASKDQFPEILQKYLQRDHQGRFYEDFYRVVIQNERYIDEWKRVMIELKQCFHGYKSHVLEYQNRISGCQVPKAFNSTSAEGNFLETLNMTLNLYEYYNIDRNFDRTGKICVVITPGPGVFDVDRDLVNITKQRILDLGVGIDLVCMGDQPLHAVPLFKFIKKRKIQRDTGDDYYIPHWINHSFYRSESELQAIRLGNFIPRIKLKFEKPKPRKPLPAEQNETTQRLNAHLNRKAPEFVDFEAHDNSVYVKDKDGAKEKSVQKTLVMDDRRRQRIARDRHVSINIGGDVYQGSNKDFFSTSDDSEKRERMISVSSELSIPGAGEQLLARSAESPVSHRSVSALHRHEPRKALINPFAPNRLNIRLTANRRRWAHVFPSDKNGKLIQPHHKLDSNVDSLVVTKRRKKQNLSEAWKKYFKMRERTLGIPPHSDFLSPDIDSDKNGRTHTGTEFEVDLENCPRPGSSVRSNATDKSPRANTRKKAAPISCQTKDMFTKGEQKWSWDCLSEDASPINHMESVEQFSKLIGVDWKSLTMPANLSVTTDYFPSSTSLRDDFLLHDYQLVPGSFSNEDILSDSNGDLGRLNRRRPLSTQEVYKELINQRLSQGFQIVVSPSVSLANSVPQSKPTTTKGAVNLRLRNRQVPEAYQFSIGRIFHHLSLEGGNITVTQYRPKYSHRTSPVRYKYRLKVPDAVDYVVSWTEFTDQMLETFSWNYLDNYICTRGDGETYGLVPETLPEKTLKFWRSRFFLLPGINQATKKVVDSINTKKTNFYCDIFEEKSREELQTMVDNFLHFMKILNKIPTTAPRQKAKLASGPVRPPPNGPTTQEDSATRKTIASAGVEHNSWASTADRFRNRSGSCTSSPGGPPKRSAPAMPTTRKGSIPPVSPRKLGRGSVENLLPPLSNPTTPNDKLKQAPQFSFDTGDIARVKDITEVPGSLRASEDQEHFTRKTPLSRILQAMLDPIEGLLFLSNVSPGMLPEHSFISGEAVKWTLSNILGVRGLGDAVDYLQTMITAKLMCHASGNSHHRFIHGAYLFCLLVPENIRREMSSTGPGGEAATSLQDTNNTSSGLPHHPRSFSGGEYSPSAFQMDWFEVAVSWQQSEDQCSSSAVNAHLLGRSVNCLQFDISPDQLVNHVTLRKADYWLGSSAGMASFGEKRGLLQVGGVLHKKVLIDIDSTERTDRVEWGTCQYHANYHPLCGFEMEIQWLVATGVKLGDLLSQWTRKAKTDSFSLLPAPCDPFALPYTPNSDPLRGPVFVPLEINCLCQEGKLFGEFPENSRQRRLQIFQEEILKRFGFMRDACVSEKERTDGEIPQTYIHCTGSMFVMVPLCDPYQSWECDVIPPQDAQGTSLTSSTSAVPNSVLGGSGGPTPLVLPTTQKSRKDSIHLEYIALQASTIKGKRSLTGSERVGFLWAWNYMLQSKKGRNASIIDFEAFQDTMLSDFRSFCRNDNDRLVSFWLGLPRLLSYTAEAGEDGYED